MKNEFKKLSIIVLVLFLLLLTGCNNLEVDSYKRNKNMFILFAVEMNNEYNLNEDININCSFGINCDKEDLQDYNNLKTITLMQIAVYPDVETFNKEQNSELPVLFTIDNIFEERYLCYRKGNKTIYNFNNQEVIINKQFVSFNEGVLRLSLTTYEIDENGKLNPYKSEGSIILINFIKRDNKIKFSL